MTSVKRTIAIVGGGASGLAAAISCARQAQEFGCAQKTRVVIIESGKRLGRSIMQSGNGRCNFSHADLQESGNSAFESYRNAAFVQEAFGQLENSFGLNPVLSWFELMGLVWKEAPGTGGLLYPYSNKANSVLEVLIAQLDLLGVEVELNTSIQAVARKGAEQFVLTGNKKHFLTSEIAPGKACSHTAKGKAKGKVKAPAWELEDFSLTADAVVVASGGGTAQSLVARIPGAQRFGYEACRPVLGPIKTDTSFLHGLNGVRVQARVSLPASGFSEVGEVLFRDYGVSGIVVFNASRFVNEGDVLELDLAPDYSEQQLCDLLETRRQLRLAQGARAGNAVQSAGKTQVAAKSTGTATGSGAPMITDKTTGAQNDALCVGTFLQGFMLDAVAQAVYRAAGIDPHASLEDLSVPQLAKALKAIRLKAYGVAADQACQVQRGGFCVDEFEEKTLMSKHIPHLFVLGEALDIDGPCGGFNLHWAWTSGLLAGQCAGVFHD